MNGKNKSFEQSLLSKILSVFVSLAMVLTLSPASIASVAFGKGADESSILSLPLDTETTAKADKEVSYKSWIEKADTSWYDASQTEFTLTTPEQLAGIAKLVNDCTFDESGNLTAGDNFKGKTIKLGNNLSLKNNDGTDDVRQWCTIGALGTVGEKNTFMGTFDGCGYEVSDMEIHDNITLAITSTRGFFSTTESATIKNLTVSGEMTGNLTNGAIVGLASKTTIENCTSKVDWQQTTSSGTVGGIVGQASSTSVRNCTNEGYLRIASSSSAATISVGGITGAVCDEGSVLQCANIGKIEVACNSDGVGGLIGNVDGGCDIADCYNWGDVEVVDESALAGGLVGYCKGGGAVSITNAYNSGTIKASTEGNSAAITAKPASAPTVTNCYYLDTTGTSADVSCATALTEKELSKKKAVSDLKNGNDDSPYGWQPKSLPTFCDDYEVDGSTPVYSIIYNYNGGKKQSGASVKTTYTYTVGATEEDLHVPVKEGAIFEGWFMKGEDEPGISELVSGTVVLVAQWTKEKFEIDYDLDGGHLPEGVENPTQYELGVGVESFASPEKDNYIFEGWFDGDTQIKSISKDQTGKVSLKAKWTPKSWNIAYELDGGTNAQTNPSSYSFGTGVDSFANPTKKGFDFVGWFSNEGCTESITSIAVDATGDYTLYAKWSEIPTYKVAFESNGGTSVAVRMVLRDERVEKPDDPTKKNYKFDGWYSDIKLTQEFDFDTPIVKDIKLYAKWVDQDKLIVNPTSIKGSGTVMVGNVSVQQGSKIEIAEDTDITITWKAAKNSNNLSLIKSIKINGSDQNATAMIDKSKWQVTNAEYKRRMKQTVNMTTYDQVLATEQSITVKASDLKKNATVSGSITEASLEVEFQEVVPVYRLYNKATSEHLFTTDKREYDDWVTVGKKDMDNWIGEGIDWFSPKSYSASTTKKVYRLYNAGLGKQGKSSHYYTSDETEVNNLVKTSGWKKETQFSGGYVFLSDTTSTAVPIWTCYNEALNSSHHYTSSKSEWEGLAKAGWNLEKKKNGTTGVFAAVLGAKP